MTRALLILALAGCAMAPRIPPGAGPEDGLRALGSVRRLPAQDGGRGTVVVISDLHPVHGALTRERDALAPVRKDNRDAIAFLLGHGFTLLGSECADGPLPDDAVARAHRQAWHEAVAEGDDVDAWTIFQPIRLDAEFAGKLVVVGVEDPELYGRDVARLAELRRGPEGQRRAHLLRWIRGAAEARGRAAARNLARRMGEAAASRAMLLLGRAHVEGAARELEELGFTVLVFEASSVPRALAGSHRRPRNSESLRPPSPLRPP